MKLVSEKFCDGSEAVGSTKKYPMSLKAIVQKHISSWSQQAITVFYCNKVFGDELSQWNKSSRFQAVSYVQIENGSRYAIKQWYAQPTTISSQSVQVIFEPHHILVNNRARVCAHGLDGMNISKKAWHEVAETVEKTTRIFHLK